MTGKRLFAAAISLWLALPAAAQPSLDSFDATGPSSEITNLLAQRNVGGAVYQRDFGKTEKDLIYKIDYDKAFLYVRFLYHVDNGAWRLIHINLKTESDLPLPRDWTHIYPQ